MKKNLLSISLLAIIILVFAACSRNPVATTGVTLVDTAGLAQFQEWKTLNERADPNKVFATTAPVQAQRKTKVAGTKTGKMTSSSTHEAKVPVKKGWSKAAKYSVAGGGAGIVLGAVINKKNRVAGGAVGGAVLGALGYAIGRAQDKKDGRL